MPTTQIDDRKDLARIAVERGWSVADVRQHPSPTASLKENKVLFEVHYVKDDAAGIVVMYNAIDKMVSAHLQAGDRHDHAYRKVTVTRWLEDYGDPDEQIIYSNSTAKLFRNKEIAAEAIRSQSGEWSISLPGNKNASIKIAGLTENVQRKVLLAVLRSL